MPMSNNFASEIRNFIACNFLYGREQIFGDSDSFLNEGIIDSTGVLQLVSFLEETYGITVEDEELHPDNLDSIKNVTAYLARKLSSEEEGNVAELQTTMQGGNA